MKKLLLTLGTITAVAVPVVAVVSCGGLNSTHDEIQSKLKKKIDDGWMWDSIDTDGCYAVKAKLKKVADYYQKGTGALAAPDKKTEVVYTFVTFSHSYTDYATGGEYSSRDMEQVENIWYENGGK